MKIQGKLVPLRDTVFVTDMDFGIQRSNAGLYIPSDDGKSTGIHPRWGRVWAVGPEQHDIKPNEWILIEHGRWTRGFEYENDDKSITELRVVENKSVMLRSHEKPSDVIQRNAPVGAGSNVNFNIPGI
jgi:co-chaperonin GroES (HSP10)